MDYTAAVETIEFLKKNCRNNKLLGELFGDFLTSAVLYARIRVDWHAAGSDGRRAMDQQRSRMHDVFIDNCNILSRNMAKQGLNIHWRSKLGDDRRVIGDFACYIHAYLGILAR